MFAHTQLTVTLASPGLPFLMSGETFSCHLADSEGRFPPITVPAVEVTQGTVYNCNITGLVPDYPGVTATINLGFQSSLFNEPFDITNQALTIYRCSAGERYHLNIQIQYSWYVHLVPIKVMIINSPMTEYLRHH